MDRLKETLLQSKEQPANTPNDRVEIIGLSIASCLNRAKVHWSTDLICLDYEILERGKQSLFHTKPYRLNVSLLPEEERFSELEEFSFKLGVGDRLSDKALDEYIVPKDKDGQIVVRNYLEGVFMMAIPPVGKGVKMDVGEAMKKIRQAGTQSFDERLVQKIVKQATGKPVKIAEFIHISENDSACKVEISSDKMKAIIRIYPPRQGGRHLRVHDVVATLKSHGIVTGFKEKQVEEALFNNNYRNEVVAAEGIHPKHGADATIDYKVNIKRDQLKLQEDLLGRVDFKNMNIIENVVTGQILAQKIPPQKGVTGCTIFNEIVQAKNGKDIVLKAGKGTILSEDGIMLMSEINGQVTLSYGVICVEPVYRVSGDVGPRTGNVNFLGSVVISGSVLNGFSVKAVGNIEIHGSLQKATVAAEGDIVVRSGIQGGRVESTGGCVLAKYIQDAKISSVENVLVADGILRSQIDAKDSIICNGRKAQIVGGRMRAQKEIRARMIGSTAYTATELTVGIDPGILNKNEKMTKSLKEVNATLVGIQKTIATLQARKKADERGFTEKQKDALATNIEKQETLSSRKKELETEIDKLEKYFDLNETDSKIHAEKQIFPGCVVNILKANHNIANPYNAVTLSYDSGYIKIEKLEKKKDNMPSFHKWRSR